MGLVNIASTLTPNVRWRGHLLLQYEPVQAMRLFHALSLPAGAALLLVAPYLLKRRRRAWQAALVLLLALGLFDLLKGLDFEETVLDMGVAAAVLFASGSAFNVRHDPITLRSALWRVPLLGLGGLSLTAVVAWATEDDRRRQGAARDGRPAALAAGSDPLPRTSASIHHQFAWIPLDVHLIEIATLLAIAYVIFRPLAGPRSLPDATARRDAADLVRAHGHDTLSFFKLRGDKQYFFSEDRAAFVGYRIENGVLLLSGDPVGPRTEAMPDAAR